MFNGYSYDPLRNHSQHSHNLKIPLIEGSSRNISGSKDVGTEMKTIDIPNRMGSGHEAPSSRRGSLMKKKALIANVSKSVDSHVLINMNSPNFRTNHQKQEEEMINSVRENYLNSHLRKNSTNNGSSPSNSHDFLINNNYDDPNVKSTSESILTLTSDRSKLHDPSLSSAGGDILRDIYKMAEPNMDSELKRQKSTEDVLLTMERNRRESTAGGLNVPGGFRREYIVNKIRQQKTKQNFNPNSNSSKYGSSHSGTPRPSTAAEFDRESNLTQTDTDVPFLTKNFLEFLYMYGHFAGESFEDDFFENGDDQQEENDNYKGENNPLIPLGSTKVVRKSQVSKVKGTASSTKVFLLLMKSFVGTGVLFLPQAFHNGGLTLSIFLLIFFGIYSYWCYYILIQSKVYTQVSSFGDIGLKTYGPWMKFCILFALVLTQVGFSSAYMIFTAKNLGAFMQNIFKLENINLGYFMLLQLIIFIPLSFIRKISKLSLPSLFANFFIMIGLIIVLVFTIKHLFITLGMKPAEGIIYGINTSRWTLFVGTAIFTFEGIGLIIPVQDSMRNPEKFPMILGLVIITATLLFVTIATVSYLSYGADTQTVILLNLPQDSIAVNLIQLFYSIAIMLSTPLQLFPAIKIIENKVFPEFKKIIIRVDNSNRIVQQFINSGKSNWKIKWLKNLGRTLIVSSVVLIAYCTIDSLDKFVSIIGSFCCLPLVYIFPAMLHLRCCTMSLENGDISKTKRFLILFDKILIVFGAISMVYTSYQTLFS